MNTPRHRLVLDGESLFGGLPPALPVTYWDQDRAAWVREIPGTYVPGDWFTVQNVQTGELIDFLPGVNIPPRDEPVS